MLCSDIGILLNNKKDLSMNTMKLKNRLLRERSQTQKRTYSVVLVEAKSICSTESGHRFPRVEGRRVVGERE